MANLSQQELQRLLKFYQVETIEELVEAQVVHIERLQKTVADARMFPTFITSNPRVG